MNKNSIKLALLLLLGVSFQAFSMNNEDFPTINCNEINELAQEFITELDAKEKAEQKEKQIQDWKKRKKLIDDKLKSQFDHFMIKLVTGTNRTFEEWERQGNEWVLRDIGYSIHDCISKLRELISGGLDLGRLFMDKKYSSLFISGTEDVCSMELYKLLIDSGVKFISFTHCANDLITTSTPLGYLSRDVLASESNEKIIKLLLAHGELLLPEELKNNNNSIISNAYQIDALKNKPEILIKKIKELDNTHHLLQRVLMNVQSPKEFKEFIEKLKEETERELRVVLNEPIFLKTDEFQESFIENYATPAIMYNLMKKGIVSITEKRINAQPAKTRQLELHDIFNHNQMVNFKNNFDMKLNYK